MFNFPVYLFSTVPRFIRGRNICGDLVLSHFPAPSFLLMWVYCVGYAPDSQELFRDIY